MHRKSFPKFIRNLLMSAAALIFLTGFQTSGTGGVACAQESETQGSLQVVDATGKPKAVCPLKHTDVKAEISGFLSRVSVTQEFENPFTAPIEAVYTFPLPQNGAVDDMTMTIGDRTVRGKILRSEEAQEVYEAAKTSGKRAGLLSQERPNIFTQSVANILPGEQIKIRISYVETLKYEDGAYEFVFPMVVGPRYIPGAVTSEPAGGPSGSDAKVPDAARITPPLAPAGMRAGHDISLDLTIDAGVSIDAIESKAQEIDIERQGANTAHVRLRNVAKIPNKDFILRYDVAGKKITDAFLTHKGGKGGYFTFILQPPEKVTVADVTPKELVFVLDTSGSMHGFPIDKAKETMNLALDSLYPNDTFNLITFSGDEHVLFPAPVPATKANLAAARKFLETREGSGGTEMMKAIKAALDSSDAQDHLRIVCFMTDGYVGNDMQIIDEIEKHPNARVFAFGIGNSVNRYLLDNMARHGHGEVEYVGLNSDGSAAARRFHERVRNPLLTDISIDWNGLPVADVYPQRVPDLFGAKPVVLTGRYTAAGRGTIRLKGKMAGRDFVREIPVDFSDSQPQHDVLSTLWARNRIDDLLSQDLLGAQRGNMKPDLKETIIQLGLEYRLMTQFTSFVAVEEMVVTDHGQPRRIDVPVEVPEGVDRDYVNSNDPNGYAGQVLAGKAGGLISFNGGVSGIGSVAMKARRARPAPPANRRASGGGSSGAGIGPGVGGNVGGGDRSVGGGSGVSAPKPIPTPAPGSIMIDSEKLEEKTLVLSPEEQKRLQLQAKLHHSIELLIRRLKEGKPAAADEAKFVHEGKAEIQVWLTDKSAETLAALNKLGFELVLNPKTGKLVIGRLEVEKLAALAELTSVRYIAPDSSLR